MHKPVLQPDMRTPRLPCANSQSTRNHSPITAALAFFFITTDATAREFSASIGLDVARGHYGTRDTTETTSIPMAIKMEQGRWLARAALPFVRASGNYSIDNGTNQTDETKLTQDGIGDLVLGLHYAVLMSPRGFGVDLGTKAKLPTANISNTLITTGKADVSIQLDGYAPTAFGSVFASFGKTKKGAPPGRNFRDPAYAGVGFNAAIGGRGAAGMSYDYRERTSDSGPPVGEVAVFYAWKIDPARKVQLYLIRGLADGSPDLAGGTVFIHKF